jgi:hypothetical protein
MTGTPGGNPNDAQQKAHIVAPHVAVLIAGASEVGSLLIEEAKAADRPASRRRGH